MTPVATSSQDGDADGDVAACFGRVRRHLNRGLALTQRMAAGGAVEVAAEGARVTLSDGRTVLDLGSYAVTLLGHRHPAVVAAVERQLRTMPVSSRAFANPTTARFAEDIVRFLDQPELSRVWLGLGGADAVEAALKLARAATGKPRVLAVQGAFHGKTLGALAATWEPRFRKGLAEVLTGVTHVPAEADALDEELAAGDVAALIFEPVLGEGGVRLVDEQLLRRWTAAARDAGALVIADEVQVGLGRCGARSMAAAMGLTVDGVLLGKALGGGVVPLSAVVGDDALMQPLSDAFFHTSTFGGYPLACAAGSATLTALTEAAPGGEAVAGRLAAAMREIAESFPSVVAETRGVGLLWGIECTSVGLARRLLVDVLQHDVVLAPCLGAPAVLRVLPPMTISEGELELALAGIGAACAVAAEREARAGSGVRRSVASVSGGPTPDGG